MNEAPNDTAIPLHQCDDQLMAICRQLFDATLAPRFQVLITQGFIELLINAVIDAKCKNAARITGNSRDFPYAIKLLLLNELGLLSDSLYRALSQLKKHRNEAAHDPFFALSGVVTSEGRPAGPLHEYCLRLIVEFYNEHTSILAPLFAPTVSASGGGLVVFPTKYLTTRPGTEPDSRSRANAP